MVVMVVLCDNRRRNTRDCCRARSRSGKAFSYQQGPNTWTNTGVSYDNTAVILVPQTIGLMVCTESRILTAHIHTHTQTHVVRAFPAPRSPLQYRRVHADQHNRHHTDIDSMTTIIPIDKDDRVLARFRRMRRDMATDMTSRKVQMKTTEGPYRSPILCRVL